MKKHFSISKTFTAIRQLPVEVSFEQVEAWVRQQPFPQQKRGWIGLFKGFLFSQN